MKILNRTHLPCPSLMTLSVLHSTVQFGFAFILGFILCYVCDKDLNSAFWQLIIKTDFMALFVNFNFGNSPTVDKILLWKSMMWSAGSFSHTHELNMNISVSVMWTGGRGLTSGERGCFLLTLSHPISLWSQKKVCMIVPWIFIGQSGA